MDPRVKPEDDGGVKHNDEGFRHSCEGRNPRSKDGSRVKPEDDEIPLSRT